MNDAERETLYQRWQEKKFNGQAFCNAETIKKCRKISDANFEYFV